MLSVVKTELRRMFKSPPLYISALLIFAIGWCQSRANELGVYENIISNMFGFSAGQPDSPLWLSSIDLILGFETNLWFEEVLIAASALCFATYFCDERTSGNIRFSLSRTGLKDYCVGKLLSAGLAAVFAVLIGFCVFSLSALCIGDSMKALPADEVSYRIGELTNYRYESYSFNAVLYILSDRVPKSLLWIMFRSVFWAWFSMAVVAVKPNKYFAIVLPAVFGYLWDRAISKVALFMKPWFVFISSRPLSSYFDQLKMGYDVSSPVMLIIQLGFIVFRLSIPAVIFCIAMRRRVDIGGSE